MRTIVSTLSVGLLVALPGVVSPAAALARPAAHPAASSSDCGTARLSGEKVFNLTVSGIACPPAKAVLANKEIYWADTDPSPGAYNPGLVSTTGWKCGVDRLNWNKATCRRDAQQMVWWGVPKAYRDCMSRPAKKGRPRDCRKLL
ncbi:MAG: hypothetical protein KGR19_08745 [Acidobacteria bacterium]|nr:hypothetical protein [Acidobacteriota bacterium]